LIIEEIHNFIFSRNIIRVAIFWRVRWARDVALYGTYMYSISVIQRNWKRPFGRHRHRWEESVVKMNLNEAGYGDMNLLEIYVNSGLL
jgi:hypothetical protein